LYFGNNNNNGNRLDKKLKRRKFMRLQRTLQELKHSETGYYFDVACDFEFEPETKDEYSNEPLTINLITADILPIYARIIQHGKPISGLCDNIFVNDINRELRKVMNNEKNSY
jgi:hypothetical protein